MKLIAACAVSTGLEGIKDTQNSPNPPNSPHDAYLEVANDADPCTLELQGITRIHLHFPRFSDGRAFSQAFLLRRRLGFQGDIYATGDVLVDQLGQMQRSGFTHAVLRSDQPLALAQQVLANHPPLVLGAYQGDAAMQVAPHFVTSLSAFAAA